MRENMQYLSLSRTLYNILQFYPFSCNIIILLFLQLTKSPLNIYATFCSCVHLLTDTQAGSKSWLLCGSKCGFVCISVR